MKRKMLMLVFIGTFYFSGVLMADKTGVGTERNQDRTGSPVGSAQQCGQCHSGGNFGTTVDRRLKDSNGNIVTEYIGGESYTYEVEVGGSASRFGFQSVALLSSNATAGTWSAQSSNGKIITMNSRKYAEHVNPSVTGLFIMNWTAPVAGSGNVRFYAAGNGVNNNNASSGDQAAVAPVLTITESPLSGIQEEDSEDLISVFPNPVEDVLNIRLPEAKDASIRITDLQGKTVFVSQEAENSFSIDVSDFEHGMYLIYFEGGMNACKKFSH